MKLAAGKYVIADPCYILNEEVYFRLLKETNYFMYEAVERGGVMSDSETGKFFAVFSTKYGDGTYRDGKGFKYGVDAGCIACIPAEMCDLKEDREYINEVTFARDFEVRYEDGFSAPFVYRLGHCPFTAVRGVRFSYGVPFDMLVVSHGLDHACVTITISGYLE
jgi:hypothetical protein